MLTVIHTSDWHLGHTLHDHPRVEEHAAFLAWLVDQAVTEKADALLVAGDLFDSANPPAQAQEQLYRFLVTLRGRMPNIDVVLVGGNHDSAQRLDAPAAVLRVLGPHMVGGLPRLATDRSMNVDRVLVPLTGKDGAVAAWVAAVPFLRPADLPPERDAEDALIQGVSAIYQEVLDAARAKRDAASAEGEPDQALLAMGHCYMVGGKLSELSERKILGGNQHALPVSVFPEDVAYVALGHLHLAQTVGGRESVRYSGAPIALSMPERTYPHQVAVVTLDGAKLVKVRALKVPTTTHLLRLPAEGSLTLVELESEIRKLPPLETDTAHWQRPFLEVCVRLDAPEPGLQKRVQDALEGRSPRLVKLTRDRTGTGAALGDGLVEALSDTSPEKVFIERWKQEYKDQPDQASLDCFNELLVGLEVNA